MKDKSERQVRKTRMIVHVGISLLMMLVIYLFRIINDSSVIDSLFKVAGYTYGPLLGLYAFGLFTKRKVYDKIVPVIAIIAPVICFFLSKYSVQLFNGYKFGYELLMINGAIVYFGLWLSSKIELQNVKL